MSNEIQNKTVNLKQWQDGNEPPFNPENTGPLITVPVFPAPERS